MKKGILAVWMTLLMMLCACSGQKQNEETVKDIGNNISVGLAGLGSDEFIWQIEEMALPSMVMPEDIPEGVWMDTCFCGMAEETIYCLNAVSVRQEDGTVTNVGYVVEKTEYPYESWDICMYKTPEEWLEGDTCFLLWYPWSTTLSEDGTLTMLLKGTEKTWLCQWKDGEYSLTEPGEGFPLIGTEEADNITDMYLDEEGNYYFVDGKKVWCVTENSPTLPQASPERMPLQIQRNPFSEQMYLLGNTRTGGFYVQEWEKEQIQLTDDAVIMEDWDKVVWDSGESGYLCSRQMIWRFSITDGLVQEVVTLPDYGYSVDRIWDCGMGKDGEVVLLVLVDGKYRILELERVPYTGKTRIELLCYSPDVALEQAVLRFNQSNREYYVEIRQAQEEELLPDFRTRIQAEMSAGKGPDILEADFFADMEAAAENSQLLELTEFFPENNILPNVWECGKVGENLYAVPYGFSIDTLIAHRNMVGERTGWTVEELMQCVRESGVSQFSSSFSGALLFHRLCRGDGASTEIIDWENEICHFDSRQAEELLEFAREYSGDVDYIMDDVKVLEGEAMAGWGNIEGPRSLQDYVAVYQDGQVFIGYPTADGRGGHILQPKMLGISSMAENKEGAVTFLQYLISEDMQEYIAEKTCEFYPIFGFPADRQALEHMYEYLLNVPPEKEEEMEEDTIYFQNSTSVIIGGYEFPVMPFTEENVGQMRSVLETAKPVPVGSSIIYDIIVEETESFFAGSKSAQEVLSVIQNRVQLYFDERN